MYLVSLSSFELILLCSQFSSPWARLRTFISYLVSKVRRAGSFLSKPKQTQKQESLKQSSPPRYASPGPTEAIWGSPESPKSHEICSCTRKRDATLKYPHHLNLTSYEKVLPILSCLSFSSFSLSLWIQDQTLPSALSCAQSFTTDLPAQPFSIVVLWTAAGSHEKLFTSLTAWAGGERALKFAKSSSCTLHWWQAF